MLLAPALLGAMLAAASTWPEERLHVRVSAEGIDVSAEAMPLSQILGELSRQTGMRIVYDGPPPATPLTARFHAATSAEAVVRLTDGLGLSYGLRLDARGQSADMLVMVAASSAAPGAGPRAPTPRAAAAEPGSAPNESPVEEPQEPWDPIRERRERGRASQEAAAAASSGDQDDGDRPAAGGGGGAGRGLRGPGDRPGGPRGRQPRGQRP